MGGDPEFPGELPTGRDWKEAANNITSPLGSGAHPLHHNKSKEETLLMAKSNKEWQLLRNRDTD